MDAVLNVNTQNLCFKVADIQRSKVTSERVAVVLIMPIFLHIHLAFHF